MFSFVLSPANFKIQSIINTEIYSRELLKFWFLPDTQSLSFKHDLFSVKKFCMHSHDFHLCVSLTYISFVSKLMRSGFCWVGLLSFDNHPIRYLGSGSNEKPEQTVPPEATAYSSPNILLTKDSS